MSKIKKPTIKELEDILDGPARSIKINPDGSLTTEDAEISRLTGELAEKDWKKKLKNKLQTFLTLFKRYDIIRSIIKRS
jgi:hypothetical protein